MIIGAIAGFATVIETGSPLLAVLASILAGAVLSLFFAFLTQVLRSNQVATGLALTLFGLGIAALWGQAYTGMTAPSFPSLNIPVLSSLPIVGELLFSHDLLIYLSIIMVFVVAWFLTRTRAGLIVRAVGENHDAAHSIGFAVIKIRIAAIAFGGGMAGLGGGYLSLVQTPLWVEGMTAGRGWIALALVVFASWRPQRALAGAYLFGGITILQLHGQALGIKVSPYYLSMLPYLATIVVLVLISRDKAKLKINAPASLGRIFDAH